VRGIVTVRDSSGYKRGKQQAADSNQLYTIPKGRPWSDWLEPVIVQRTLN
jgi:hypothetical protein